MKESLLEKIIWYLGEIYEIINFCCDSFDGIFKGLLSLGFAAVMIFLLYTLLEALF